MVAFWHPLNRRLQACHVPPHPPTRPRNELFVNVKVDREERPDVDKVYMTYVTATQGGGGWPMSCFLTPRPVGQGRGDGLSSCHASPCWLLPPVLLGLTLRPLICRQSPQRAHFHLLPLFDAPLCSLDPFFGGVPARVGPPALRGTFSSSVWMAHFAGRPTQLLGPAQPSRPPTPASTARLPLPCCPCRRHLLPSLRQLWPSRLQDRAAPHCAGTEQGCAG